MFYFDGCTNTALNGHDSRVIIHRGLDPSASSITGFTVRNGTDSLVGEVVDTRTIIRELSASQKLDNYILFFSVTVNQTQQPGLKHIKEWLDDSDWKNNFQNFFYLQSGDQEEIHDQMLRNWLEIRRQFIDYLINSTENVMLAQILLAHFVKCITNFGT